MDYHFVKYENEDSFIDTTKNSPQAIRSFIGMKILANHSGFHDEYEDTSSICDDFLDFNKDFIDRLEPLFKKDDNYLRFYIDFSITSLISICTMKYFERSINFLKNLAVLRNEKYSFLTLHQRHPEILMKSFLLVVSLAISRRAPSHFFIKPILDDDEEEEEEEEGKEDGEENDEFSLFDRVEELTSFIKKEYNYFNSLVGSSISLKIQKEIIVREITENGIFPISVESQKMIELIFDQSIDLYNSEIVTQTINQFNLSEYNPNILSEALIDFSKKYGEMLENFVCYSNPESYINNALSMKMGILIPTKCSKRHTGFLAANCTSTTPASSHSPKCYYCISDRCRNGKNKFGKSSENENGDNFMFFGEIEDSESVILLNIYNIIDELHPIEANFLRIILLAIKYKNDPAKKKEAQQQINVAICAIATLLFPYTSYALSNKAACVFVRLLLIKFEILYFSLFSHYHNPTPHEFRKLFSALIAPILKGVFENVSKELKNPTFMGKDVSKCRILMMTPSPLCRPMLPMGSKYFLRSFLLNPLQRTKCPVIYAYLRLNDRFDRARFIPKIVPFITKIFDYVDNKRGENIDNIKISQIKGYEEFLKNWKMAAKDVVNDLMTTEARLCLKETLDDDPKISFFLPICHKNWPLMNVLLSCSEAHNKFVKILNEYRNIVVNNINDTDISLNSDNFRLRNSFLNVPLLKTIKGDIDQRGDMIFTEKHEQNFCDELSLFSYNYIIHSSLSLKALALNGESLITRFTNRVSPKPLTFQQKNVISIIKKEGKGVGLVLLLESLILKIIEVLSISETEGKKQIIAVIQDLLSSSSKGFDISSLERDALKLFIGLRGKSNEPFLIQQIPGIYNMLTSNTSESNEVQSYVIDGNLFAGNHSYDVEDSRIIDQMKEKSLSEAEWLDLSCIILQLLALTKNTNQDGKNQTIFEVIKYNFNILSMSNSQEILVLENMKDTFDILNVDDLNSLYMFCSKKSI